MNKQNEQKLLDYCTESVKSLTKMKDKEDIPIWKVHLQGQIDAYSKIASLIGLYAIIAE